MKIETLKRILRYARPKLLFLIITIISAIISVAATLYVPVIIGDSVNLMIGAGKVDFALIVPQLSMLGVVVAVAALFQWLMNYSTNVITHNVVLAIREDVFEKLQALPLSAIDKTSQGDIMSRVINDVDQISDGLLQGFTQLFSGVATILGTIIFMLSINLPIGVLVIIITPLSLFVASFIAKRTFNHFRRQAEIKGELAAYAEEMIGSQSVVKAFGYEELSQQQFDQVNEQLYQSGVKAQFYSSLTNPCTRFVNSVVYVCVGVFGAISVINGGLTVGMLSAFLAYANQYTKPFNEISGVVTELQSAFASARRVFELLDMQSQPPDNINAVVLTDCDGEVKIENVDFSYTKEKPLIENFNFSAKPGERIAIVGPTGCGKTTMINLLMRFYEPQNGSISVDGINIADITRDSLRRSYGMVLQDTWLFKGTVRENIAYGKPNASEEEIVAAAKLAHAHSFIKRLENGYDTMVSDDGDNISQGQKQLLCIARIMLTAPPMLILDEATSSIDTRTEIKIQKAFAAMMEGRTSFIVAHRLSTIKESDCILVMRDGNVVEQGSHDELLERHGFYHTLYNSQFKNT